MEADIITGHIPTDNTWAGLTPHGRPYTMRVRPGTSDWNTVQACSFGHDEYHVPEHLQPGEVAVDVGAHIGACVVPLLLDNPEAEAIAVEALPENVQLLITNLERNGVASRCLVLEAGAGDGRPVRVAYGELIDASRQHEYIGNAHAPAGSREVQVEGVSLGKLVELAGGHIAWLKIDCEGCEYPLLQGSALAHVGTIEGEVHDGWPECPQWPVLQAQLAATHDAEYRGEGPSFGPFTAKLRTAVPA